MADETHDRFQLERLAFFSDAVFAIAITLLVIEIHVPEVTTERALREMLLELIPKYIGFVVSFFVIGRFWLGHHRLFGHLGRCDEGLFARNIWLLMLIAFGPFPTALISSYANTLTAVSFYCGWLAITGLANISLVSRVAQTRALWNATTQTNDIKLLQYGAVSPIIIAALAFLCALYRPGFALIPLILSPLILMALRRVTARRIERAAPE